MADDDIHEGLSRVISQLTAAVTNTSLYSPTHPQVAQYVEKAHAVLAEILQNKPEITLLLIGNDLVADNRQMAATGSASYVTNFIRILKKQAIERITFVVGTSERGTAGPYSGTRVLRKRSRSGPRRSSSSARLNSGSGRDEQPILCRANDSAPYPMQMSPRRCFRSCLH